jgi:hypothetical protein
VEYSQELVTPMRYEMLRAIDRHVEVGIGYQPLPQKQETVGQPHHEQHDDKAPEKNFHHRAAAI